MNRSCFVPGLFLIVATLAPRAAVGQTGTSASAGRDRPFEITDNSFFVEEAFNQDPGVVQNIFIWTRSQGGAWEGSFTQEWPAPSHRHQLSYSVPFAGGDGSSRVGAVLLNYRFQVLDEAPGHPAFSPRLSVILPTGDELDGGNHGGLQINLPFSRQRHDFYLHGNAGLTWIHSVPLDEVRDANLMSPFMAGSLIWRARPMMNLMLESVAGFDEGPSGTGGTIRQRSVVVSPGVRGGWNLGEAQLVVGAAAPVTWSGGGTDKALLTYISYELPFSHIH